MHEIDAVALLDQMVEILGFAGKRLLQEPEEAKKHLSAISPELRASYED